MSRELVNKGAEFYLDSGATALEMSEILNAFICGVIGGILGNLLVLIPVALLIWFLDWRKKRKKKAFDDRIMAHFLGMQVAKESASELFGVKND